MDHPEEISRLSAAEQDLAMFLEEGGTVESLNSGVAAVRMSANSLTIPFTHDDGSVETVALDALLPLGELKTPLAEVLALRTQEIERVTLDLDLGKLSRFVEFLAKRRKLRIRLEQIDNALLRQFRDWLDAQRTPVVDGSGRSAYAVKQRKGGQPFSVDYKRELYRTATAYLNRVRLLSAYGERMQRDLDLNADNLWKKRGKRDSVPVLTRPELKMLVRLCREEVVETTRRLRAFWAICDGTASPDDLQLVDQGLAREVQSLAAFFGTELPPPCHDELRVVKRRDADGAIVEEFSKRTFPLLWSMKHLVRPAPRDGCLGARPVGRRHDHAEEIGDVDALRTGEAEEQGGRPCHRAGDQPAVERHALLIEAHQEVDYVHRQVCPEGVAVEFAHGGHAAAPRFSMNHRVQLGVSPITCSGVRPASPALAALSHQRTRWSSTRDRLSTCDISTKRRMRISPLTSR